MGLSMKWLDISLTLRDSFDYDEFLRVRMEQIWPGFLADGDGVIR